MKKKENIIIIVVLIVLLIAIVGVSYAAFNYSRVGNINSITTGAITMTYTETDNTISLNGALPTTDKTGMVRLNDGEYFDFSISSEITGDVNINYEISAKDITVAEDGKKIDGSNIKLYLTKLNGESEESLMTPETYNEEIEENTYTGRPSGEMSLYTSSMNSSESNNYRLRMYVTEEYNPQGDGGGLTFSVQINVYGKAGDKYFPLAVETLLAKANEEDLDYNSATTEQQKEMWTFSHPVTEQTEALTDYRYIGSDPNNYIEFNDELWRIIGVFTVDDGTGKKEERLKIIRDETIGRVAWRGSGGNNWLDGSLANNLNSGDFWTNTLNDSAKEMIGEAFWYLGGTSDFENLIISDFYDSERSTTVYTGRSTSWVGKVGLIYPSDYGYATSGGTTTSRNACLNYKLHDWGDVDECGTNNWMTIKGIIWTMTINASSANNVHTIYSTGFVSSTLCSSRQASARPVVFLKSDIRVVDGNGSSSDPYILQ